MHKLTVLSALSTLVLSTFLVTACDDAKNNVAAPTTFNTAGVSASVTAGAAIADPNAGGTCAAFTIPLSLVVQSGSTAIAITSVTAQFLPNGGMPMPQVTLPAPVPTVQFGSALADAKQTIPLVLPIGCVVNRTGTVVVFVSTRDGRGNSNTTSTSTPVGGSGNTPGSTPGNSGNTPAR